MIEYIVIAIIQGLVNVSHVVDIVPLLLLLKELKPGHRREEC